MKPGSLLISQPFLGDPNFERSVVLLCRHRPDEGAFGLVLTRRTETLLGDVLELPPGPAAELPLYEGGPVQLDTLHFVHRHATLPGATALGEDAYWGGDFDLLISLINTGVTSPDDVRCFVGYSGLGSPLVPGKYLL
jgi:putative transcriptional regulator